MFMQPMPNGAPGISRPFVVAVVLLLLFLSIQTDWSPPRGQGKRDARLLQAAAPEMLLREATKEKIIFDLSVSNEKLEKDNFRLRQHLLDLRRAARQAGLNLTTANTLLTYPEMEQSEHVAETEPGSIATSEATNVSTTAVPQQHSHRHRPRRAGPFRRLQETRLWQVHWEARELYWPQGS